MMINSFLTIYDVLLILCPFVILSFICKGLFFKYVHFIERKIKNTLANSLIEVLGIGVIVVMLILLAALFDYGSYLILRPNAYLKIENKLQDVTEVFFQTELLDNITIPQRGTIVLLTPETKNSTWRKDIQEYYHFYSTPENKGGVHECRVIGLPNEKITVLTTGKIYINGKLLNEPYLNTDINSNFVGSIQLYDNEFFSVKKGEDWRIFFICQPDQIKTRKFFVLWPFEKLGFIGVPNYNISSPYFKFSIDEKLIDSLRKM